MVPGVVALSVYNTLGRSLQPFIPADPRVVRIYSCGLTVYSQMHIGHARTYCFWDLFRRYLEYRGFHVMSVINYTDIDDRIIQKANEQGVGCQDIAEAVISSFREDCRALCIKDYALYTRATDFVQGQIEATARLIERGHAYIVEGEVLYEVQSFEHYGCLSGNRLDQNAAGASGRLNEAAKKKRHPADFTLWKPSKEGEPSWQTGHKEWPSGRPGWHIECSVMSSATLGQHFDVHGGGSDNLFPHHENEIAQSQPFCGDAPWVKYWMHPAHLQLIDQDSGEPVKMSKSLGNVISIPELLSNFDPEEVRWFFASTHYRSTLAFNYKLVEEAAEGYKKIRRLVDLLAEKLKTAPAETLTIKVAHDYASQRDPDQIREYHELVHGEFKAQSASFIQAFQKAMDEDMGSPGAVAAIFDYVNKLYTAKVDSCEDIPSVLSVYRCLLRHLHVFGIERADEVLYPSLAIDRQSPVSSGGGDDQLRAVMDKLVQARHDARAAKDWERADQIRDILQAAGIAILDGKEGVRWEFS